MLVERLTTLAFRNLAAGEVAFAPGVNVAWGPNGAGKTNLLEALYTALAGRSCRTRNDRETIAFGQPLARAEALVATNGERSRFMTAIDRAEGRHQLVDGTAATAEHADRRPPLAVFMPERLVLVKGAPAARRAHLDRFCAALWPARADVRQRYGRALAQRNALLARVRAGAASPASLDAWDRELAEVGVELIAVRERAAQLLATPFASACRELGLEGEGSLAYRPASEEDSPEGLVSELRERRESDLSRGFTGHGPHRDELALRLADRTLRRYGSQGQQRIGVLALLFAEREALLGEGRPPPLMLLDDVTSELDRERRALLCSRLEAGGGQALLTATEREAIPGARRNEIAIAEGRAIQAARDAAA